MQRCDTKRLSTAKRLHVSQPRSMQQPPLLFLLDENQFSATFPRILKARGHRFEQVTIAAKDPSILVTANLWRAIILTADRWFLKELFRLPEPNRRRRFNRAGVVQLPGEIEIAVMRFEHYLPVVEAICHMCRERDDQRVDIEIRPTTSFIHACSILPSYKSPFAWFARRRVKLESINQTGVVS
jgi:hypothetical protein